MPTASTAALEHNRAGLAFGDGTGRHYAAAAEEVDLERCRQAQPAPFAAPATPAIAAWRYHGRAAFDTLRRPTVIPPGDPGRLPCPPGIAFHYSLKW
ncbi:hypothetical protein (plasmid) [Serratia marcescens]|uniref:Uncharacterized protein n=1 Tax=Serratia marcescens TaxID=615 RepID=A0A8X6FSJ3_SERMA|nr:hypothetical protein [Serratia marcescens]BCG07191.1 hypothetical protein [Serratia marcescens]BCG07303.1 hypothetical protein [Serratia marcescens]BCT02722.1 hypothetical protein [Serratia marcescens]BCT02813.1 hypothetical protein [Serratia marcescens]